MNYELCIELISHLLAALLTLAALLAATNQVVVLDCLVGLLNASLERAKSVTDANLEATHDEIHLIETSVVSLGSVALHCGILAT